MTETESYLRDMAALDVEKIVFSSPCGENNYKKTSIRRLKDGFQAEHFTEKQAFHENFPANLLEEKLNALFPTLYKQAHFVTETYFYDAKLSKKGKLLTNRTKNTAASATSTAHDRKKQYIINAENLPPVFYELGVAGADGKILRAKFDKFRQICRFTELLNDVLKNEKKDELHLVDFGCGKSYLTFVVYYYITEILHKRRISRDSTSSARLWKAAQPLPKSTAIPIWNFCAWMSRITNRKNRWIWSSRCTPAIRRPTMRWRLP